MQRRLKCLKPPQQLRRLPKTKIIEECVNRYAAVFLENFLEERKKKFAEFTKNISPQQK